MLLCHPHPINLFFSPTFYFSFTGWMYLIPTVLAVSAAMLCKEQGITICGVCAIYEIFVAQKVSTYVIHANILPP